MEAVTVGCCLRRVRWGSDYLLPQKSGEAQLTTEKVNLIILSAEKCPSRV